MKKETAGRAGTSLRGKEATTEIGIEKILRRGTTAREGAPGITEAREVGASSVLPRRE